MLLNHKLELLCIFSALMTRNCKCLFDVELGHVELNGGEQRGMSNVWGISYDKELIRVGSPTKKSDA